MDYHSLILQFFASEKITDYNLSKIEKACAYFDHPERTFQSIHIAGTNGKGSVAKMIFQMLKESGKKVGVFTSPHLYDPRERWMTESGYISEEDFTRLMRIILDYGGGLSGFERCAVLAFLYFREQECEYAVIEVGLGGRLDATNIITPILSIITSISYDHMDFLGDTLEQIAYEKGGIIKAGVPVILYGENHTLEQIAIERNAQTIFPRNREISTNLLGEHQLSNARIAYEAGLFLGISENTIKNALLHVDHHGRMEYILPNLLIDGAHNEDGIKKLHTYISSLEGKWKDMVYCMNLKKGKSIKIVTDAFSDVGEWIVVQSPHPMVEDSSVLSDELRQLGRTHRLMSPIEIKEDARKNPEKLFVVFGSLYMIGEFLLL